MMGEWSNGVLNPDGDQSTILASSVFERQAVFSFAVALRATRNDIPFRRFSAPYERNQVIHREFIGRKFFAAVMTDPQRSFPFPPLRRAQLTSLLPLAPDFLLADVAQKRF